MSKTPRSDNLIKIHGISTTRNGDKAVLVSDYKFSEDAFALARQLELELAELRQQIEKMKCCENCKHAGNTLWDDYSEPCNDCSKDASKWEPRA